MSAILDLGGPQFLFFYLVLALWIVGLVALVRRLLESGPLPRLGTPDPYQIALLRAGAPEAIRLACLSLYDRGLLTASGAALHEAPDASARVRKPLERAVLAAFRTPAHASQALQASAPLEACAHLRARLREMRLLPTREQVMLRLALGFAALALLWGVAFAKIQIALERGRHNVGLLLLLGVLVPIGLIFVLRSRQTVTGARLLVDLQTLFARLRDRSGELAVGGATNELALLVGVFGFGALAGPALAEWYGIFPVDKPRRADAPEGSSCSSSCSSSSASSSCSSSSSCGSSCGGGGGCGGCGS